MLEIADGVVQTETTTLLEQLSSEAMVDKVIYTCNDSLGVSAGVELLRRHALNVVAVSGWVGCSPLSVAEAQPMTELPVLRADELQNPLIAEPLLRVAPGASAKEAVG